MSNPILRAIILTLIACGLSGAILFYLQSPRTPRTTFPTTVSPTTRAAHTHEPRSTEQDATRPIASASPAAPARAPAPRPAKNAQLAADPADDLDLNDPTLRLPLARFALSAVGMDDLADALWLHAINDPTLAASDRKDLIEDLNEDGFPDPKNLTRDDLPLIEARLALIDTFAPDALDQTNADAFTEARKDLAAMRQRLVDPPPQQAPTR